MEKLKSFGPLFVIFAAFLWSADGILRISLYSLPPEVIVFWEHTVGFLVLVPFSFLWMRDLSHMTKKEWIAIVIVSFFSGALGTLLYTAALQKIQYTQYSVVVLLQQQLQPIWAIAAASLILNEKITKQFLIWVGIALIAAYLITFKDLRVNVDTGQGTAIAGLLSLGAGFAWGTSTAISKFVLKKVHFLTGTALRFFFAPMFAFLFTVTQGHTKSMFAINSTQWMTLGLITVSTGLVALLLYYYGLKRTPARVTTICELVWPASALCIDYFAYHKTMSMTQILGVFLLFVAIYQVTKQVRQIPVFVV